jgi:hypothetical protein
MLKLIKKITAYAIFTFIFLEILVRVFHLYNDLPQWYLDENKTYRWIPGQEGYTVYGNRRQKFSQYRINKDGFNSYREFNPTADKFEVALLGDSFIEGFHQDYYSSIGKKIENRLDGIEVYEYGHSSFDFADQLHLVEVSKGQFDYIDLIVFEVKYENDLKRDEYSVRYRAVTLPFLRHSKLIVYMLNQGMFDPVKEFVNDIRSLRKPKSKPLEGIDEDSLFLENFKKLVRNYKFDKSKMALMLDSRKTDSNFLKYLEQNGFRYIDYGLPFEKNKQRPTTLIYDRHWNNFGRKLVAKEISDFIEDDKSWIQYNP